MFKAASRGNPGRASSRSLESSPATLNGSYSLPLREGHLRPNEFCHVERGRGDSIIGLRRKGERRVAITQVKVQVRGVRVAGVARRPEDVALGCDFFDGVVMKRADSIY